MILQSDNIAVSFWESFQFVNSQKDAADIIYMNFS